MIKKINTIAVQVFKTKIKKVSYYWMLLTPLLLLVIGLSINKYIVNDSKEKTPVIAISAPAQIKSALIHNHDNSYKLLTSKIDDNVMNALLRDGASVDAVIKISNNFDKVSLVRNTYSSKSFPEETIKKDLNSLKIEIEASRLNLTQSNLQTLLSPPVYKVQKTSDGDKVIKNDSGNSSNQQMFSSIVTIIIFILIGNYISIISSEIGKEKGNHVIESILSAVPAKIHFAGKFIGTIYLLIFQVICYGFMFLTVKFISPIFHIKVEKLLPMFSLEKISIQYIVITVILMILSILTYVLLAALLASLVSKTEDISQVTGFLSFFLLFPYGISFLANTIPNNIIIKILSYLPLTSQNVMPMRMSMQATGYISGYVAILVSLVATVCVYCIASNTYTKNALTFDNDKLLKHIWNFFQYKIKTSR